MIDLVRIKEDFLQEIRITRPDAHARTKEVRSGSKWLDVYFKNTNQSLVFEFTADGEIYGSVNDGSDLTNLFDGHDQGFKTLEEAKQYAVSESQKL